MRASRFLNLTNVEGSSDRIDSDVVALFLVDEHRPEVERTGERSSRV